MSEFPPRQGLYDPRYERDACGIGFVAHIGGTRSHGIVQKGLELLDNMSHRGAVGCDPCTGDGAGVLLQVPRSFLARACADAGLELPANGAYGVGMLFLPRDAAERRACELLVERAVVEEGARLLGWRDVPTDETVLGEVSARGAPVVRQLFVARGTMSEGAFERKLYVIRRQAENAVGRRAGFYVASLSARTV